MNRLQRVVSIISIFLLAACGGGGGGGGSTETVISGVAAKGLLNKGTVTVFALKPNGDKGTQLGTGTTDENGAYRISIGTYNGPVLVEAYGRYTDEATGSSSVEVPATAPLRAILGNAAGSVTVPVTPLTELAVLQAKQAVQQAGSLTVADVNAINARISDVFKVDILAVTPVAPTTAAFQASTQSQKDYALALAAVSQMMVGGQSLATTLNNLNAGISSAGMSSGTATAITTAANSFIVNPENKTGVTTLVGSALQSVGVKPLKVSIVLAGSAAAIQATLVLPKDVVLRSDTNGAIEQTSRVLVQSDAASGLIVGKYNSATNEVTIGFINVKSLTAGGILTLNADLTPGATVPDISAFSISSSTFKDINGDAISGASLTLKYL